jgi:hypothetical protein
VKSEDIRRRRWTNAELDAARRIAARQATGDDSGINYDEIPRLTEGTVGKNGTFARRQAEGASERAP